MPRIDAMIEIAPNVFHVPGRKMSRFPYCSCLYLKGRDRSVLIDAGMGRENLAPCLGQGLDLVILTHCHLDHRLTRRIIPDVPVWCHEEEAGFLRNRVDFFNGLGWGRSGFKLEDIFPDRLRGLEVEPQKTITDGEKIDLGGLTLIAIHTPGHTPGHLAFFIPEADLLFAGDVDLTPFGPYYGHAFADIARFQESITKLKNWGAGKILTGHAGPFADDLNNRFNNFSDVIEKRDQIVLASLDRPRAPRELVGRRLIFPKYPAQPDHILWAEQIHIEKQLERLVSRGLVQEEHGLFAKKN
ncbi:MAG: MBL fold metallo-hydrolase [Pseudomonadota bacterium]